jgi:type IV secretion system protein VirD4
MAEYRPYRITNGGAQAQLTRVKLIAVSSFLLLAVLINWIVTQHVARLFGYAPGLGPSLIGNIYAPWGWLVWWTRWHWAEQLQPLWELCIRQAAYPLIILAMGTGGVIGLARYFLSGTSSDLHGSARWATAADVRSAGLIAPRTYLPQSLRRLAVRMKLIKPLARRVGIYLGVWQGSYLRDCGPGHVLVMAPTRSGKGVGVVVPTLLTWPHSTLVHDLKGENWQLTAGARQRMGHICLKFDPTDTTGTSVKFNPLEQVRLRTVNEAEDVQNIVHMIIDPDGKGLNDHWVKTGAALLTGTILHLLYAEPNKTLRGVAGFLSDPGCTLMETIERMLKSEHDPAGAMAWRDHRGIATRTHPLVAESMREILSKSDNERAGVFSTVMSFLSLYRDPIVAANTQYSEFKISDLVNHDRPVSLYLVVPMASRDRLRPLIRLILNQIVRTLTTTLAYKDGRAVSANRHPLLLMLDEFPMLGRLEVLAEALSLIAGYGIRACLVAQDLTQIYAAYGHDEAVTINCDTTVAFAPNKIETARALSELTGETTVRHAHRMVSSIATSVSEPETGRSLMTPDEVRRLSADEVLIFTRGHPAIRTRRLKYHQQNFFQRRASIAAPEQSDRITAAPGEQEKEENVLSEASMNGQAAEQTGEELTFLSYGASQKAKSKKELV